MDTWITISQNDVLASINSPELTAALTTALASGQDNPIDSLIADTVAEVRAYLRPRNTLGQPGSLPQELKNAAIDIIIYRAANRLRKPGIAESKKVDYELAMKKLDAVSSGKIAVSVPDYPTDDITSAPGPRFAEMRREFGREEERGI